LQVEGRCLRGAEAGNGCGKGGTGERGGRLAIWWGVWWTGTRGLQALVLGSTVYRVLRRGSGADSVSATGGAPGEKAREAVVAAR
jgi:hypothetical protein